MRQAVHGIGVRTLGRGLAETIAEVAAWPARRSLTTGLWFFISPAN